MLRRAARRLKDGSWKMGYHSDFGVAFTALNPTWPTVV